MRYGLVVKSGSTSARMVAAYLPARYEVTGEDDENIYFAGEDYAGWTMDDYVIPRMQSGMIWPRETAMLPQHLAQVVPAHVCRVGCEHEPDDGNDPVTGIANND
jgi:hypothetical protein